MLSILNLVLIPLHNLKSRKKNRRNRAFLADPPPPVDDVKDWDYGADCFKATVEAHMEKGELDRTFIGYSQNMNISDRTKNACERYKQVGTMCGESQVSMKGGECDEVIFMKLKNNNKLINLTNPFR